MHPHFQACRRGTGLTLPTIPTPRHGRGEHVLLSIFQASRIQAKESFTCALQIQWQVPG